MPNDKRESILNKLTDKWLQTRNDAIHEKEHESEPEPYEPSQSFDDDSASYTEGV